MSSGSTQKTRAERFALFVERLKTRVAAASAEEAVETIASAMNEIEDRYSGIVFNPATNGDDGRLYPAQMDNFSPSSDPEVIIMRHRKHRTYVRSDGAFVIIRTTDDSIEIEKRGTNGTGFAGPYPEKA